MIKQFLFSLFFLLFSLVSWEYGAFLFPIAWLFLFLKVDTYLNFWIYLFDLFLTFLLYNYLVVGWLLDSDNSKGIFALIFNSFFLTVPFFLVHFFKSFALNHTIIILIFIWMSMELLFHYWSISWTWLTIGNIFSNNVRHVQWYQFTGVLGGSFWILIISYFLFKFIKLRRIRYILVSLLILITPVILSYFLYQRKYDKMYSCNKKVKILAIHTNLKSKDSILEKNIVTYTVSKLRSIDLSNLNYVVTPEVFLPNSSWIHSFKESGNYIRFKQIAKSNPNLKIILGLLMNEAVLPESFNDYPINEINGQKFKSYNSALQIDTSLGIPFKVKKKYVPFSEYVPYIFRNFNIVSANNSFMENNINNFLNKSYNPFISICYEITNTTFFASNFGKSNFTILLSSEAFLKHNQKALNQYLNICRLRAIETGSPLFKISNGGISCSLDKFGDLNHRYYSQTETLKLLIFNSSIELNNETFYVKTKGYLNFIYPVILLISLTILIIKNHKTE